jgi:hypothetical protein
LDSGLFDFGVDLQEGLVFLVECGVCVGESHYLEEVAGFVFLGFLFVDELVQGLRD